MRIVIIPENEGENLRAQYIRDALVYDDFGFDIDATIEIQEVKEMG